jgi:hypothetical protein
MNKSPSISSLKCSDSRHFIHLAVGDDTLPEEEQRLAEHLHLCSDCRAYHAGMVDAMHAVERVRDHDVIDAPTASLWPAMADKLKVRQGVAIEPERRRFNGSVVALCACSLMLALVTAVQNLPSNSVDPYADLSNFPPPAMNVNFQSNRNQGPQPNVQRQLIQVAGPNGEVRLIDPVSNQMFVPQKRLSGPSKLARDASLEF